MDDIRVCCSRRCCLDDGWQWDYVSRRNAARFIQVGCGLFTTLPHRVVACDWAARTCIASNGAAGTAPQHAVMPTIAQRGSRHYASTTRDAGAVARSVRRRRARYPHSRYCNQVLATSRRAVDLPTIRYWRVYNHMH